MDFTGRRNCATCDILIVGAGPAGTAAAIFLSGKGFSVTVIEKDSAGRGKICGDLLGPRALKNLAAMNLLDDLVREGGPLIREVRIFDDKRLIGSGKISPNGPYPEYGIALERVRLDSFLQKAAEESGARIVRGIRFKRIEQPEDTWIYSQAISEEGERSFRSKMILGADGVHSTVAKQTGLFQRIPSKMIFAVRTYFQDVPDLRDGIELYFEPELLPGYGWVIPLGGRRANIGIGIRADVCMSRRINLRRQFHQFVSGHPTLSKRLKDAQPVGEPQGWPIGLYGQALRNYAPHVLLLGDAGNFADPISGEGIYGALESARHAGATCDEALKAQRFDEPFLARYEARWRQSFHDDFHCADLLVSLPSHRRSVAKLVLWGIRKMSKRGLSDERYGSIVTGFFCGAIPRKEALKARFIKNSLLG